MAAMLPRPGSLSGLLLAAISLPAAVCRPAGPRRALKLFSRYSHRNARFPLRRFEPVESTKARFLNMAELTTGPAPGRARWRARSSTRRRRMRRLRPKDSARRSRGPRAGGSPGDLRRPGPPSPSGRSRLYRARRGHRKGAPAAPARRAPAREPAPRRAEASASSAIRELPSLLGLTWVVVVVVLTDALLKKARSGWDFDFADLDILATCLVMVGPVARCRSV
jgi:hypothetical protein